MRRAAGLGLALSCVVVHVLAYPQETAEPRSGDGLQFPSQRRSHLEKDPERYDFFGELREQQCQDDLDCDSNSGRVCARKPNDAAGHCQCPPEKPNKDAQGQCQPAEQQGCQQNADCRIPLLECVERQCRCVAPNVAQAHGSCAPPQEPSPTKSTWLSPLAFLFSILLLMTCTVFVTRYRKDEDALDEEDMPEAGAGGAAAPSCRSWSGTTGVVAASTSAARVQPKPSSLGGASCPLDRGVTRPSDHPPGSPQEASSASRVQELPPSDNRVSYAASQSLAAGSRPPTREQLALQQSSRPRLRMQAFAAAAGSIRTADAAPRQGESIATLPPSTPVPGKQPDRCSSEDIQLPDFVRSPTQQGGDMGWPEVVPVQRIRRGLQLLGSVRGRDQLQHFLDGRDLFEREEEGAEVETQQLLQSPPDHVPCSKTVQTDITLAPAIVPFAALDTALWPLAPSRCGTAASKASPTKLTVDSGDYAAGHRAGLEPGSSELFLAERHQKPVATEDAPLLHQSPTRGIGGRGGEGAASAQHATGLPSPWSLRVRASGEGPSCSSQLPDQDKSRCDDTDAPAGHPFSLGSTGKTKSRFSIRPASSDELDGLCSESATANDNQIACATHHDVVSPVEEASADPTSEPPSELLGTAARPQHASVGEGETSSQGPDAWSTTLRAAPADEDASVSFQSFDVEAQVVATQSRALVVERQVAVDVCALSGAAPLSEPQER